MPPEITKIGSGPPHRHWQQTLNIVNYGKTRAGLVMPSLHRNLWATADLRNSNYFCYFRFGWFYYLDKPQNDNTKDLNSKNLTKYQIIIIRTSFTYDKYQKWIDDIILLLLLLSPSTIAHLGEIPKYQIMLLIHMTMTKHFLHVYYTRNQNRTWF